jgi:gluconate 2-dehydrogenase gamma chain
VETVNAREASELSALLFLNEHEAAVVEAIAARVVPGDVGDPGAREAGVIVYIDRALAGFHRDLQPLYSHGLRELAAFCQDRCGCSFDALDVDAQDALLGELDVVAERASADFWVGVAGVGGPVPEGGREAFLAYFFAVVRQHVVEGMFADPAYGGNRDGVGWRLVGFPGAQWGYSSEQRRPGYDVAQIPIKTLADLRREHARTDESAR